MGGGGGGAGGVVHGLNNVWFRKIMKMSCGPIIQYLMVKWGQNKLLSSNPLECKGDFFLRSQDLMSMGA